MTISIIGLCDSLYVKVSAEPGHGASIVLRARLRQCHGIDFPNMESAIEIHRD